MKRFLKLAAFCLAGITMCGAVSQAASDKIPGNWYGGISGDLTWPSSADMGGGANLDFGYRLAPGSMGTFRVEAEAAYHTANGDNGLGDLRYFNYMGNAYYDFANIHSWGTKWRTAPYIGGGAGLASIRRGQGSFTSAFHHHSNAFAYQGMAGLAFSSTDAPAAQWTIGYRYFGTDRDNGLQVNAHNLELGLRYFF